MIDTHAHVYQYVTGKFGLDADMVGVQSGVFADDFEQDLGWTLEGRYRLGPDVEWIDDLRYDVDPAKAEEFAAAVQRYLPEIMATAHSLSGSFTTAGMPPTRVATTGRPLANASSTAIGPAGSLSRGLNPVLAAARRTFSANGRKSKPSKTRL